MIPFDASTLRIGRIFHKDARDHERSRETLHALSMGILCEQFCNGWQETRGRKRLMRQAKHASLSHVSHAQLCHERNCERGPISAFTCPRTRSCQAGFTSPMSRPPERTRRSALHSNSSRSCRKRGCCASPKSTISRPSSPSSSSPSK